MTLILKSWNAYVYRKILRGTHLGKLSKVRYKGTLPHGNTIIVLFGSKAKQLAIQGAKAMKNTALQVRMDAIMVLFIPEAVCNLVSDLAQSDMKQGVLKQMEWLLSQTQTLLAELLTKKLLADSKVPITILTTFLLPIRCYFPA